MKVALTLNRALVLVVLLFSLPLFLDPSKLPDSLDAQEYIFAALTPCNGLRICNLCGDVLEMVDLVQRGLVDPFTDELTLSAAEWDPHGLQSYQRCLREPIQRGCDTLIHKVKSQRIEFAKLILEQILEDVSFQHKWGMLGEDYIVSSAMRLTNYIFEAQERSLGGRRDAYKEESAARSVVYQNSALTLSGDPAAESLITRVWFLRRDVQQLHKDFCQPVCEAKLNFVGRVRLELARFYIHHSIKPRLQQLRKFHRGTLMVAELMMIGLAVCVERLMRTTTPWGTVTNRGTKVQMGQDGGGGGGGGGASSHTSSSTTGGGGGGGKGHYRQGRRK